MAERCSQWRSIRPVMRARGGPSLPFPLTRTTVDSSTVIADDGWERRGRQGIDELKGAMAENEDIQVHEGRRAGVVVSVRLKPAEADLLEALAQRDGRTLSETLRVALHLMASSPGAGRELALHGELSPTTRGGSELILS